VARTRLAVCLVLVLAAALVPALTRTGSAGARPSDASSPTVTSTASVVTPRASLKKAWIGGDSAAYQIQFTLAARLKKLGVSKVVSAGKSISGLAPPDFYNWPVHLKSALASLHPQAVVFMVGMNDGQGMTAGGKTLLFGTAAWKKEYTKRVKTMMDAMRSAGVTRAYWIGMPIMRSASFGKKMALLNTIFRAQAAAHPDVTYVDAWKLFSSSKGTYVAKWRSADGMHFNIVGVNRLVSAVVTLVKRDWS
jgi:peptidoglycan DL-endopeptidase LytF